MQWLWSVALILLAAAPPGDAVRINQIQVIGTHNSYHAGLSAEEMEQLRAKSWRAADALDYSHPPLDQQLSAGIRQIELDVFADPQGGRYADTPEMKQPGFKVMHLQNADQHSTCPVFKQCLDIIRTWSQAHPRHLPLFILVECKPVRVVSSTSGVTFETMTPALFDALDAEIRSVFPPEDLITPDQVRGPHASLLEAIRNGGWPTLSAARGKVIFLLDNRDLASIYAEGHPALRGRIIFPNAQPGTPDAAFTELNSGPRAQIEALVRQGYLVRTRADADTLQARARNTRQRDEALASGAQIISTDYPASEPARWTGYSVSFPGGMSARCNPVLQPPACRDELLENK